jgi:hypothetical protein
MAPTTNSPSRVARAAEAWVLRSEHPIAKVIGAVLIRCRDGDQPVKERVEKLAKGARRTGKGALVALLLGLLLEGVGLARDVIRRDMAEQAAKDRGALIQAINHLAEVTAESRQPCP